MMNLIKPFGPDGVCPYVPASPPCPPPPRPPCPPQPRPPYPPCPPHPRPPYPPCHPYPPCPPPPGHPCPPPCPIYSPMVCVDPLTNHICICYPDGQCCDTGVSASCCSGCPDPPPSTDGKVCKSRSSCVNGAQYTSTGELILYYLDGTTCSLGTVCQCKNVIFSQNPAPPPCDECKAKCGDVFVSLGTGDVYQNFGTTWDLIGNLHGSGPTGGEPEPGASNLRGLSSTSSAHVPLAPL